MTIIEQLLNLANSKITDIIIQNDSPIMIQLESTEIGTFCKCCGKHITKKHSLNKIVLLKHLPIFGNEVYIKFQPVRYQCIDCEGNPTTTQIPSWYQSSGHCTQLYAQHILNLFVNSTVKDVAQKENISHKRVSSIIKKHTPTKIDWSKIKTIKNLGIDEIALKKGHKDYVVIVSARVENKTFVLGVLKDRKKDTVKEFLSSIPKDLAKSVANVCCDMYDGFINAAKEVLGSKVKIIIDRFHIAKNYRNAIETVRKKEMKRLKEELSEKEYKKLTNVMWILRKQYSELTDKEKQTLKQLFKYSPTLKKAYNFRNKLTAIFNQNLTQKQAKRKIKQWIKNVEKSELDCFDTFIKTLKGLWNEILNYFINRLSSGFVEGLNNKIKVIKRRCYGIFKAENLFQRICIDLAGYNLIH